MAGYFEWKKKLLRMMEQSAQLAEQFGYDVSAESIMQLHEAFVHREVMVVTVGEARRGKSSLLNALLNECTPLFPVDIMVCTNVVTIVRYGEKEKVTAVLNKAHLNGEITQEPIEITREQIADYVTEQGNEDNAKNVAALEIELPNELLREGVVFVDTPGVGSMNVSHAQVTYGFLPNADLLLFVGDSASGFTETELKFLEQGYEHCKNIVFPLTKKDLNQNYPVIAEDNRAKIHAAIGIPAEEISIIPVSSTAKLNWIEHGMKSNQMYKNSNYEELERVMWESIRHVQADRLLLPCAVAVCAELDKVSEGIAAQRKLLHADSDTVNEMVKNLKGQQERLEQLQGEGSQWKKDLGKFFSGTGTRLEAECDNLLYALQDKLDNALQNSGTAICAEANYTRLLTDMNGLLGRKTIELKESFDKSLIEQLQEVRKTLSLDMDVNRSALENISFKKDDNLDISYREKKGADELLQKGRIIGQQVMPGSYLGLALGGIGGAVIGMFVGMPVQGAMLGATLGSGAGTVFGVGKGVVEGLGTYDNLDMQVVKKAFTRYISRSVKELKSMCAMTVQEMKAETLNLLDQELKKQMREVRESIERISLNVSVTQKELPQKKAALERQDKIVREYSVQWEKACRLISAQLGTGAEDYEEQGKADPATKKKEEETFVNEADLSAEIQEEAMEPSVKMLPPDPEAELSGEAKEPESERESNEEINGQKTEQKTQKDAVQYDFL